LTEKGYGQRTYLKEYRKTGRAAKGVKNITLNPSKKDKVIAIKIAKLMDILISTEQGQVIRMPVDTIRITHRKAKGVRVIKLYANDSVVAIGKCATKIDDIEDKVDVEDKGDIEDKVDVEEKGDIEEQVDVEEKGDIEEQVDVEEEEDIEEQVDVEEEENKEL
jgi:DNA gyrase subunit A